MLAASDVCYLCGHPGSGAVDHVISRKQRPDLALDPANLRPVHGSLSRCRIEHRQAGRQKRHPQGRLNGPPSSFVKSGRNG